jgi:H+/gluconate symporter-like permease
MKYIYLFLSVAFNVVSYLVYKSISNKPGGPLWKVLFAIGLILAASTSCFSPRPLRTYP